MAHSSRYRVIVWCEAIIQIFMVEGVLQPLRDDPCLFCSMNNIIYIYIYTLEVVRVPFDFRITRYREFGMAMLMGVWQPLRDDPCFVLLPVAMRADATFCKHAHAGRACISLREITIRDLIKFTTAGLPLNKTG